MLGIHCLIEDSLQVNLPAPRFKWKERWKQGLHFQAFPGGNTRKYMGSFWLEGLERWEASAAVGVNLCLYVRENKIGRLMPTGLVFSIGIQPIC